MQFYERTWASNYDQLITYYPRYYRNVFEMDAILHAAGSLTDQLADGVEKVYFNNFLDYCDEETLSRWETFLGIQINRSRTLEERRRYVKAFVAGFGKISASMIAAMIYEYTHARVDIWFEPSDPERNNTLFIHFLRGDVPVLYMNDIITLLQKRLPAHINWHLAVVYRYAVVTSARHSSFTVEYPHTGTRPDAAQHARYMRRDVVTSESTGQAYADYNPASEDKKCGTFPKDTTLGSYVRAGVKIDARSGHYPTHMEGPAKEGKYAGTYPHDTTLGSLHRAPVAVDKSVERTSADYTRAGNIPEAAQVASAHRADAVVKSDIESGLAAYAHAGTRPQPATLADYTSAPIAVSSEREYIPTQLPATDGRGTGSTPREATIASLHTVETATEEKKESLPADYPEAGTIPTPALQGSYEKAPTVVSSSEDSHQTDYPAADADRTVGTLPSPAMQGLYKRLPSAISAAVEEYLADLPATDAERGTGTVPDDASKGAVKHIDMDSGASWTEYQSDLPVCGEFKLE